MTITQTAKRVGCTRQRVYNAIERKELRPVIVEPVTLIDAAEVDRWKELPPNPGGWKKGRPRTRQS